MHIFVFHSCAAKQSGWRRYSTQIRETRKARTSLRLSQKKKKKVMIFPTFTSTTRTTTSRCRDVVPKKTASLELKVIGARVKAGTRLPSSSTPPKFFDKVWTNRRGDVSHNSQSGAHTQPAVSVFKWEESAGSALLLVNDPSCFSGVRYQMGPGCCICPRSVAFTYTRNYVFSFPFFSFSFFIVATSSAKTHPTYFWLV